MALEVVYEGTVAGTKSVSDLELSNAAIEIVAGRICTLKKGGLKDPGVVYFGGLTPASDTPLGLNADYKDDVIASGKASVYFTQGLYMTDQTTGSIAKGDTLTFTADGLLTHGSGLAVGICTEAAGDDGFIEMFLNITGAAA